MDCISAVSILGSFEVIGPSVIKGKAVSDRSTRRKLYLLTAPTATLKRLLSGAAEAVHMAFNASHQRFPAQKIWTRREFISYRNF